MILETERFGQIEVDGKNLLHLPNGIMGFPDLRRVLLLDHNPESPFRWLQSVDHPELAFVVIDPFLLFPDYPMDELMSAMTEVEGTPPKELAIAAITTVPPAPAPLTVNLVAPVVFNAETRVGAQVILKDKRFRTRHIILRDESTTQPEQQPSTAEK